MLTRSCLLITVLCMALPAQAADVQSMFDGRVLNASLVQPDDDRDEAFLIIHGTWAHHGMEIVQALQQGLADRGEASLAPTLSLGQSDRKGFLDCSPTMTPDERTVGPEIRHWLDDLGARGYRTVTLLGHSRGALQAARVLVERPDSRVTRLVMLGPMTWRYDEVAAANRAQGTDTLDTLLHRAREAPDAMLGPLNLQTCTGVHTTGSVFLDYYDPRIVRHTPDLIEHVRIRTDVVLGTDDEVAPWTAEEIAAARLRRNVRLIRIDGADHFFRDLYMDEVLDSVLSPAVDLSAMSPAEVQVLFIALSDCPVCRRMEKEVLYPLLRSGALNGRATVTELLLDDPRAIVGFDGKTTDTNTLAAFYSARMTPSLLFLDAQGIPLHPAITGYNDTGLYAQRVERAVEMAARELRR
jgi:pimeloyl-ACP methyl ester carboxylesterase